MREYLEKRIAELKKADAEFCEKRWDMTKPEFERAVWREASNGATGRRQELEGALAFYNKNCGKVVVNVGDVTEAQKENFKKAFAKSSNAHMVLIEEPEVVEYIKKVRDNYNEGLSKAEQRKQKRRINFNPEPPEAPPGRTVKGPIETDKDL